MLVRFSDSLGRARSVATADESSCDPTANDFVLRDAASYAPGPGVYGVKMLDYGLIVYDRDQWVSPDTYAENGSSLCYVSLANTIGRIYRDAYRDGSLDIVLPRMTDNDNMYLESLVQSTFDSKLRDLAPVYRVRYV